MEEERIFNFTVGELIQVLRQFPEDMPIVVDSLESGFENFFHPYTHKVKYMPENWYTEGVFQSDKNGIEVVVLQTETRYE